MIIDDSILLDMFFVSNTCFFMMIIVLLRVYPVQELSFSGIILFRNYSIQNESFSGIILFRTYFLQNDSFSGRILIRNFPFQERPLSEFSFWGIILFRIYFFRKHDSMITFCWFAVYLVSIRVKLLRINFLAFFIFFKLLVMKNIRWT